MSSEEGILDFLITALDPIIAGVIDTMGFPLNAIIAFLWGGISEIITEVLAF